MKKKVRKDQILHLSPSKLSHLTSGAIQNGVPTDVFRPCQVYVSWADTPGKKRQDLLPALITHVKKFQFQYPVLQINIKVLFP